MGGNKFSVMGVSQKWVKSRSGEDKKILQGLGVGPGSATEHWPCRKNALKSTFFHTKNKNYVLFNLFLDIPSSYAKVLGETNFQPREFPRSGSKAKVGEKKKKRKRRRKTERW